MWQSLQSFINSITILIVQAYEFPLLMDWIGRSRRDLEKELEGLEFKEGLRLSRKRFY